MPQLNQLALVAYSQFFWLLLVLGLIYFGIGKFMLPKIQSTVDAREKRVTDDLAAAQAARTGADETEAAYRSRMDASRGEASIASRSSSTRSPSPLSTSSTSDTRSERPAGSPAASPSKKSVRNPAVR